MKLRTIVPVSALLIATPAFAQKPTDVVRWTVAAPAKPVKPGAVAKVELKAQIEDGWYLYAMTQPPNGPVPLEIAVAGNQPFTLDRDGIDAPLPKIKKDPNFDAETQHYDEKVSFTLPLAAPRSARPGAHTVPVQVTFQACSGSICLRPFTETVPVTVIMAR